MNQDEEVNKDKRITTRSSKMNAAPVIKQRDKELPITSSGSRGGGEL